MKKINKKIVRGFLAITSLFLVGLGIKNLPSTTANAHVGVLRADTTIAEKYSLGTTFEIPEGDIIYNGQNLPADAYYLKAPNGSVYEGREHTLNQLGLYTVMYSIGNGANMTTAEQSFTVIQATYGLSSNASTAVYTETLTRNTGSGMQVGLAEGDTFTFNQPIDVTQTDEFFSFYPHASYWSDKVIDSKPNGGWAYDIAVNKYIVRLTDCYNADNYVEVEIAIVVSNKNTVPYSNTTYLRAGVGSQVKAGMNVVDADKSLASNSKEVYMDGIRYQVWYGDTYGTSGRNGGLEKIPACTLRFDAETNGLYFSYGVGWSLINDLDNTDVNKDSKFTGFETGEVYLSVYAADYLRPTAEFEVAKIGEYEGTALLLSDECQDTKAPELFVDSPFDLSKKLYAAKGETLPVFNAWAKDVHLVGDVTTRVYYAYDSLNPMQVFMKDGKFTTTREGDYTIVYTAADSSGNVTKKTITFAVIDKEKSVSLEVDALETIQAGTLCSLPAHTINSLNDEEVIVSISATWEGDEQNVVKINPNTREFFVEHVGTYEIRYVCQGVVITTEYTYEVESVSANKTRIDTADMVFPKYFIKNAVYSLDEVVAYRYDGANPTRIATTCFVSEDGGAEREIDTLNYKVTANSTVRFKYVSGDVVEYSKTLKVVDVGFGDSLSMQSYFVGNEIIKESKNSSIVFTANVETGTASTEFINVLSLRAFSIALKVPEGNDKYQSFNVILTDYYDEGNVCVLKFSKTSSGDMMVQVNDGIPTKVGVPFVYGKYTTVSYVSSKDEFSITGGPSLINPVQFTSDRIILSLSFENVKGAASMEINSLSSQRLSKITQDNVAPTIAYNDEEKGERSLGTVITLSVPMVGDVLSPYCVKNVVLKFYLPDGTYATALDSNVLLDGTCRGDCSYQVKLESYGAYRVEVQYKDQAENGKTAGFAIYVSDEKKPTLTFDGGYDEKSVFGRSLNDTFTVIGYQVDDDFGVEGVRSWVAVISPMNETQVTAAGETIKLNKVGRWKVCYYAMDAQGNSLMRYYSIDVK